METYYDFSQKGKGAVISASSVHVYRRDVDTMSLTYFLFQVQAGPGQQRGGGGGGGQRRGRGPDHRARGQEVLGDTVREVALVDRRPPHRPGMMMVMMVMVVMMVMMMMMMMMMMKMR